MPVTGGPSFTMVAAVSLAAYQYHIVTLNTSGLVKLANNADVVLEPLFILLNAPLSGGEAELALPNSIAKVVIEDTIDEGASVTCNGNSHGIGTTTGGDWCVGIALEAGVSGDVIKVLVTLGPYYVVP